jgi:hypothetical protein
MRLVNLVLFGLEDVEKKYSLLSLARGMKGPTTLALRLEVLAIHG